MTLNLSSFAGRASKISLISICFPPSSVGNSKRLKKLSTKLTSFSGIDSRRSSSYSGKSFPSSLAFSLFFFS